MENKKKTATISSFGEITKKGNQTIKVNLMIGYIGDFEVHYIASTPNALEAAGLEVGQDITEDIVDCEVRIKQSIDPETGEEKEFRWIVPS